ncbi:MAG TPA: glycoside hydrolase family 130 protein [Candidatus Nanopelagicales bacterium]
MLRPDPARVVSTIFLPGQEMAASGESRSTAVLERVLALSESDVEETLARVVESFGPRHRDLPAAWATNSGLLRHRLVGSGRISAARLQLIGAYFTQEYAVEGAALFNPSMVEHPDQSGLEPGSTRFLMTVRAVGEGHVSSVELRTGVIDVLDVVRLDPPPTVAVLPAGTATTYVGDVFAQQLREHGGDHANSDFVLDALPATFTRPELDLALAQLRDQLLTRGSAVRTIERIERIAACNYAIEFPASSSPQERVIMPRSPSESHGIEDVRVVRFLETDGGPAYLATYTAYDGSSISSQLLQSDDFRTFTVAQLSGPGSKNKGMALFPRRVRGRYVALSRADRESNAVTTSVDLRHWETPVLVQTPHQPWEIVQLGNCGPPIETESGWLVLTHGVGPMRQYSIGALLLDLDDPTVVTGRLSRPLLTPAADERSGYVPNVVYSCGAMLHGRTLVLPYGCSDWETRIALVDLDGLLTELRTEGAGPTLTVRPATNQSRHRPQETP